MIAHTLKAEGADASEDGTGRGVPLVPVMVIGFANTAGATNLGLDLEGGTMPPLTTRHGDPGMIAFNIIGLGQEGRNHAYPTETSGCLQQKGLAASGNEAGTLIVPDVAYAVKTQNRRVGQGWNDTMVPASAGVRRLTPRECERLQGLPDDWTLVPYRGRMASDGPRYKAIGNSFAVPPVRWIGERIETIEHILTAGRSNP